MIIPAGSSNGEKIIRPSRSHNSTKLLPKSAEQGKRKRASLPKSRLQICGMISPIKPSRPAKLTTHPARMLARDKSKKRVSETRSPRERAMSSPSPSRFNGCARNKETKNAIAIQRHGRISLLRVSPEREPIRKDVRFTVISVFKSLIVLMPALKKLETVIPARMIVVLELSESAARKKISSVVSRAPQNAKTGSANEFAGKKIMASMTAKPEPELTPIVLGLASELFITPCKITPEQDRPIPAKSPPSTRGMRTVVIKI